MTTMFRRKQRRNPTWLKQFFRKIGYALYYKRNGMSWMEAWEIAGRVI